MTSTTLPFFVLGAADHEMQAIEALLAQAGAQFAFAATAGRRVTPATAYAADGVIGGWAAIPDDAKGQPFDDWHGNEGPTGFRGTVWVECAPTGRDWPVLDTVGVADHHRPMDPGAGKRPTEFLAGSSLGQVIAILARHGALRGRCGVEAGEGFGPGPVGSVVSPRPSGSFVYSPAQGEWRVVGPHTVEAGGKPHGYLVPVDRKLALTAALDHCPAAACRGECPGVDPAEALAEFARRSGCTPEEVAEARIALLAAPAWVRVGLPDADGHDYPGQVQDWPHVADLTGLEAPEIAPDQRTDRGALPGLRVAMMIEGRAAVARVRMPDGREKIVLQGAGAGTLAGEDPVREFLTAFERAGMIPCRAPNRDGWDWRQVTGAYGDATRGYAGAEVVRG